MSIENSPCTGNGEDHCCYVNGEPCMYLGENVVPGRRWACTLYVRYGNWDDVHLDAGYIENVQSVWDSLGTREDGTPVIASCGDWGPGTNQCCFKDYIETEVQIN